MSRVGRVQSYTGVRFKPSSTPRSSIIKIKSDESKREVLSPEAQLIDILSKLKGPVFSGKNEEKDEENQKIDFLLDNDQITRLMGIKNSGGFQLFNLDEMEILYLVISQISEYGFDHLFQTLTYKTWNNLKDYFENGSPALSYSRQKILIDLNNQRHKIEVSEGAYKCKKCGRSETISTRSQLRRADEPMTERVTCVAIGCGFTFTV